ncbi:hypothetical protein U5B43_09175 [Campylobacter sp. 9BO]|uniref:hypothetical protein n=1 Tax=Campylobacter sp. 9BO TaxID=3424759 RepID=UPI003D32BCB1
MKFVNFNHQKTLSLANLLSLTNEKLASELSLCEYRYISYFQDPVLNKDTHIRCEIGSISYVLALLCKYSGATQSYFDELDDGFLSGECNVGEEEFETLCEWLKDAENIIIDSSFFTHPDAQMLFEFLEILDKNIILADAKQDEYQTTGKLCELKELENFDGSVVYKINSQEIRLVGGLNFALVSKIKNGDKVKICLLDDEIKFEQNDDIKGVVALLYAPNLKGYCFELVKLTKV